MLQTKSKILAHSSGKKIPQNSKEFKIFFLFQFTKELIKHSVAGEVFELENILKKEEKELSQVIKKKIIKKEKFPLAIKKEIISEIKPSILSQPQKKEFPSTTLIKKRTPPKVLRIPEPKLPSRLQYLKPTPTNIEIDLEKLNPLVQDPMVKSIVCNKADDNLIVMGTMGTKKTNIILSKEEIDQIIKKFSETAKIPLQEGIFRVAVGKLILSAIISEVISSKFIIRKMMYAPRAVFGR